jgi:hypothetical protein
MALASLMAAQMAASYAGILLARLVHPTVRGELRRDTRAARAPSLRNLARATREDVFELCAVSDARTRRARTFSREALASDARRMGSECKVQSWASFRIRAFHGDLRDPLDCVGRSLVDLSGKQHFPWVLMGGIGLEGSKITKIQSASEH